jgi:hypothetical protein
MRFISFRGIDLGSLMPSKSIYFFDGTDMRLNSFHISSDCISTRRGDIVKIESFFDLYSCGLYLLFKTI